MAEERNGDGLKHLERASARAAADLSLYETHPDVRPSPLFIPHIVELLNIINESNVKLAPHTNGAAAGRGQPCGIVPGNVNDGQLTAVKPTVSTQGPS